MYDAKVNHIAEQYAKHHFFWMGSQQTYVHSYEVAHMYIYMYVYI